MSLEERKTSHAEERKTPELRRLTTLIKLENQITFVLGFLKTEDLMVVASVNKILSQDVMYFIKSFLSQSQVRIHPALLPQMFSCPSVMTWVGRNPVILEQTLFNQELMDWASSHFLNMKFISSLLNGSNATPFFIRQPVLYGPARSNGSGIRECRTTRAHRGIIHKIAQAFGWLSKTYKILQSNGTEEVEFGCECCCDVCCTHDEFSVFADRTDFDPPSMGVLVKELDTKNIYLCYDSKAEFFICLSPPHNNPKKNNKKLNHVIRGLRGVLANRPPFTTRLTHFPLREEYNGVEREVPINVYDLAALMHFQ